MVKDVNFHDYEKFMFLCHITFPRLLGSMAKVRRICAPTGFSLHILSSCYLLLMAKFKYFMPHYLCFPSVN